MSTKLKGQDEKLSLTETPVNERDEKVSVSPTSSEEFRKQSEQELLDRLMRRFVQVDSFIFT